MLTVPEWRLEARSENQNWPVSQEHRQLCVENALVDLKDANPRVRDAARKYLLAVDLANQRKQEMEQKRIDSEHAKKVQLIEYAVKLGLVNNVIDGTSRVDSESSEG